MTNWDDCDHEWRVEVDSQFHSQTKTAVICTKCSCPDAKDTRTANVFWPAT